MHKWVPMKIYDFLFLYLKYKWRGKIFSMVKKNISWEMSRILKQVATSYFGFLFKSS